MSRCRNGEFFILEEWAPEAEEILQSYTIRELKELNKRELTEAIVEARVDTGLVVFTRNQIQQRLDVPAVTDSTFLNRLQELVDIGILSVDTTLTAYQYTLAIPLAEPVVSWDTWQNELESFRPTALGDIPARSPSHAELPVEFSDTEPTHSTTRDLRYASVTAAATAVVPQGPDRLYAAFESGSASTDQYANPAKIVLQATVVAVLCAVVAISLFGSPPMGLGFLIVGLGLFSLWISLSLASYVTSEWADPVDIRPGDLISTFE